MVENGGYPQEEVKSNKFVDNKLMKRPWEFP